MKLSMKISLGTALVFLVFSQLFSLWSLSETRQMTLDEVRKYEVRQQESSLSAFYRTVNGIGASQAEHTARGKIEEEIYLRTVFRDSFDMNTVFYLNGEELYNMTPYTFDMEEMETRLQQGGEDVYRDPGGRTRGQILEQAGDRHLLLSLSNYEEGESTGWILGIRDITEVYQKSQSLFWQGFGVALVLGVLLLLPLQWIIGRILQSFYRLKEAAVTIAGGDYEKRVPVGTKDEVGQLSESFNQMAESIQAHVGELSRINERQQQMLGSLAHELKTPMMSIQGYAESLQRLSLSKEQQEKSLGYIESECRRLSRLSAKMLELTGLYQADGQMEWKEICVQKLFAQAETLSQKRREGKQISLEVEAVPSDLQCKGDEDMLMSLLLNLIDNACKASVPGSRIWLGGDKAGLWVTDEGCGIALEEVQRVTEAFYMVDKSRSRREGGAGLGLAICQEIAAAHGGRLEITSVLGKGTKVALLWE